MTTIGCQLRAEHYRQSGRNAKTIVKYPDLRTAMQAKTTIHERHSGGRISVQTWKAASECTLPERNSICRADAFWCWTVAYLTTS